MCCKQRGIAIKSYYGKLNQIWDSFATYWPLRIRQCVHCVCDLGTSQEADREEEKGHQFLFGLYDQFRTVRSSLVARLEEVYNIVRQEEDLRSSGKERPEVAAFAVQTKACLLGEGGVLRKHCNRTRHSSESCYGMTGYPEWWGDRPKSQTLQGIGRRGSGAGSSEGRGRGQTVYANYVNVPDHESHKHVQVNYVLTDQY